MSKGKLVAVCVIWLALFGIGAAMWRLVVTPLRQNAVEEIETIREAETLNATKGSSPYKHEVTIALDSFSGYAVLRSPQFSEALRRRQIKLTLVDDAANYVERLEGLRSGQTQMAAFTIDALLKTSSLVSQTPATIVALIDETQGADAMLASKSVVKNVDDLNHPDTRFVVTPDSPSETLARVVMSTFSLDQLVADPFVFANDANDVFDRYRASGKDSRQIFVVWEPYVSKILANDSLHVVIDSSRFTGYIVDCLVADRDFLLKQPEVAQAVVETYFRVLYEFRQSDVMQRLVIADAGKDLQMTAAVAEKLVSGIRWINTQENFSHFGLRSDGESQHISDMIENITGVLLKTGAIKTDPTKGDASRLFYDKLLMSLRDGGFHPGDETETIHQAEELPELTDVQWDSLAPVGTLAVPDLVFARGTQTLTQASQYTLDTLVETLKNWPQYYVVVQGDATRRGDLAANKDLALRRAQETENYLVRNGVSARQIRATAIEPSGVTRVTFQLAQVPY